MATDSIDYSNDILQPMQDAGILRYRDMCGDQLPAKLFVHHCLTIQHRWKQVFSRAENEAQTKNISPKCKKTFYAPATHIATVDNCTFVAISCDPFSEVAEVSDYIIYVFTLEWPPTELISCLKDTKRIDWHAGPLFEALSEKLLPAFEEMFAEKRINCEWSDPIECAWMPKREATAIDIRIPNDVFFNELSEHHASTINESWAYRNNTTSCNYIRSMIQLNGGLGLFEKSTKRILAWMLVNDHFALGCLETIPAARRRGLAKLLVLKYSQQFATNENLDVFTYIGKENLPSLRLFHGIGFRIFHRCHWVQLERRLDH